MNCKGCGKGPVLVESTGNGGKKLTCQGCGHHEVVNRDGQRLLTDDAPARPRTRQLVEG